MGNMIKVGMADLKACKCPDALTTLGLGSCVGVALYDKTTKIAGLVHVMLPDSTKVRKIGGLLHCMLPDSTQFRNNSNIAKFADTGIDELIRQMKALGAVDTRIVAKIAGGAQMFANRSNSEALRVGERNVIAVKAKLKSLNISILSQDCGENFGRTVEFYSETGDYVIKAVGKPLKTI